MILTFLLGALAGAAGPLVEPHAVRGLTLVVGHGNLPGPSGQAVAGHALALVGAALLLALASGGASPLALCLGGLVGAFHRELRRAVTDRMG